MKICLQKCDVSREEAAEWFPNGEEDKCAKAICPKDLCPDGKGRREIDGECCKCPEVEKPTAENDKKQCVEQCVKAMFQTKPTKPSASSGTDSRDKLPKVGGRRLA